MDVHFDKKAELIKFIKYSVTGLINTCIDLGTYSILIYGLRHDPHTAKTISYTAGMANNYVCNRLWTFKTKNKFFSLELAKFSLLVVIGLACSQVFIYLFYDFWHLNKFLSNLFSTMLTTIINYYGTRRWVFSDKVKSENI